MSRNLADLQAECKRLNLTVKQSSNRIAKSDYEIALRDFYWRVQSERTSGDATVMPEQIAPMLARNVKDIPSAELVGMLKDKNNWVAQEKINGCRCTVHIRNPSAGRINHLLSRRLSDETYRLNELHHQMPHYRDADLGPEWEDTIIDGEILMPVAVVDTRVYDGNGVVTADILQATAATMNCSAEKSIAIQNAYGRLNLHVFDCLRFKGRDVRKLPYVVLDSNGQLDSAKESRYNFASQVVAAFTDIIGDIPCQHCSGELPEVQAPEENLHSIPTVAQEDFMSLID